MKYFLRKDVMANVPHIEISDSEYQKLREAREVLLSAFEIEEIYEVLVSTYLDFETRMLAETAAHMLNRNIDGYKDAFETQLQLNIRLMNLLMCSRHYVDNVSRHTRDCLPGVADAKEKVDALKSAQFDAFWEYRFMEGLRNYVQHRELPIYEAPRGGRWVGERDEYYLELRTLRSRVERAGIFTAKQLEGTPSLINLKATTRVYIQCLSRVHDAVRSMINESTGQARSAIENAHQQYLKVYQDSFGLGAFEMEDVSSFLELREKGFPLLLDWDNVRIALVKKNQTLVNLSKRYVTSK